MQAIWDRKRSRERNVYGSFDLEETEPENTGYS